MAYIIQIIITIIGIIVAILDLIGNHDIRTFTLLCWIGMTLIWCWMHGISINNGIGD